ncbi:MAG: T9SS type A sorting domain-containing protein [bacterium]
MANPIMFVAQVPIPRDSQAIASVSCNHTADPANCGRGGDLYIRYPNGTLKNLTKTAGFGDDGLQGEGAIAVREPSIHWDGKKALFSMVVGAQNSAGQNSTYFWQIYEVTNFGENETPKITKIPNQPSNYNNVSPIYGTDDRIIFTSDRPRDGNAHLYPLLDEGAGLPSTTGLWSLDPVSNDLFQMEFSPSGSFNPFIDSYGRVVFTRWDHLTTDPNTDSDALGLTKKGNFIYVDETSTAEIRPNTDSKYYRELFPEPEIMRQDLLSQSVLKGLNFNEFFPWQINEDGTSEETLNHVGRHDLATNFGGAVTNDDNVVDFDYLKADRINKSTFLQNFIHPTEDPLNPGLYYGINFSELGQHASGQIVSLDGRPSLDPSRMKLNYITDSSTIGATPEGESPLPNHSGHYRNPLPLSDGRLIAVHTSATLKDKNIGTRSHPISRYDFRLKTLTNKNGIWIADSLLTPGIVKPVTYYDPDTLVHFSNVMWELDPVEVRVRIRPTKRTSTLSSPERQIFIEEGIDEQAFRKNLSENGAGMLVSRNVTHRDKSDHQQPYFLRIPGTQTVSPNARGEIYDVPYLYLFQADQIRGLHLGNSAPIPGRRVLAQFMHDPQVNLNHFDGSAPSTLGIANDGSFAAIVPARRAVVWGIGLTDPVVGERYWITTQPGEIRVCASCHGTNDEALVPLDPAPQNKPEALRNVLKLWRLSHTPLVTQLINPPNESNSVPISTTFTWYGITKAVGYQWSISENQEFTKPIYTSPQTKDLKFSYHSLEPYTTYYWRVKTIDSGGNFAYSGIWKFRTGSLISVNSEGVSTLTLSNFPNPFNNYTTITFSLPQAQNVKLRVFDILGKEYKVIPEQFYLEGEHNINWNSNGLPSGTYYLQIQTESEIIRRVMRLNR